MAGGGRKAPPLTSDMENVKKIKAVKNSMFFYIVYNKLFLGNVSNFCIQRLPCISEALQQVTKYDKPKTEERVEIVDPSPIEISSVTFPSLLTRSWSMRDRPGTLKPPGSSATKAMMMIIRLMCIIIMLIMVLLQPWQCNDDDYFADMHHHRLDV